MLRAMARRRNTRAPRGRAEAVMGIDARAVQPPGGMNPGAQDPECDRHQRVPCLPRSATGDRSPECQAFGAPTIDAACRILARPAGSAVPRDASGDFMPAGRTSGSAHIDDLAHGMGDALAAADAAQAGARRHVSLRNGPLGAPSGALIPPAGPQAQRRPLPRGG